jgi:hypothetical protein
MMAAFIGFALAGLVAAMAHVVGLDRQRSFYPVVLLVVGSYYVLFAVMAAASGELLPELLVFGLFAAAAIAGFRTSLWLVVFGLALHGLFDFVRGGFLEGSGVPQWWPAFCGAYDVAAAAILAAILRSRSRAAHPVGSR